MRRALFVASAVSYFREMAPVVWYFADHGWSVTVLFGSLGAGTDKAADECRAHGVDVEIAPSSVGYGYVAVVESEPTAEDLATHLLTRRDTAVEWRSAPRRLLVGANRWLRLSRLKGLPGSLVRMGRIRRYARSLMIRIGPDAVFQGAYHCVGEIDNAIAQACMRRGVSRYCLPNSGYVGGRIMSVGRRTHLDTGMASTVILANYDWVNRLFARLFPGWTCQLADGRRAFYWDPLHILMARLAGLFFERLWMKPALDFTRAFVFSDYSRESLRLDGYPMEKVVVSGEPLLDVVWRRAADRSARNDLFRYLNLPVGAPFMLVNIEPAMEHRYCDPDRHWALFASVMEAVTGHNMPVVLSLHPLCDAEKYEFAQAKFGVFICKNFKIHDLYPWCAFSVSFPCSTNLLAAIFKKQLVIFDFFGLTDADADSAVVHKLPDALVAKDGAALATIIRELVSENPTVTKTVRPDKLACEIIFDTVAGDVAGSRADLLPTGLFTKTHGDPEPQDRTVQQPIST